MNKTELKNFAVNSRMELLSRVCDRAALYGITEEKYKANNISMADTFQKADGSMLSQKETDQRKALEERIRNNGFDQVMEEAAYIWFNRFIALRYMEKHNLLPIDIRVIPQKAGELPQLVREAQNISIEGINLATVLQLLDENKSEELYRYLIISLCNHLSSWLPQMFEKINDYTELLFPEGLLKSDSFLGMLANVEEDNWDDIQVIGWLYQYYISQKHDEIVDIIKTKAIKKEDIPAATCLYTTDWVVRYMVENSLGRIWLEGHPNKTLQAKWAFFMEEDKQVEETDRSLSTQKEINKHKTPEQLKILDPCMGSGHILVYSFDVLMDIYRSVGYTDRDAVQCIVKNNIFGLDIDDRASQLAYFSIMMKACEYDKRFLKRGIQPNVRSIQESNTLSEFTGLYGQMSLDKVCIDVANQLISTYVDAKEYGSILVPHVDNLSNVDLLMEQLKNTAVNDLEVSAWFEKARKILPQLAEQSIILQQKYDAVVTNPPYMNKYSAVLKKFIQENYSDYKSDLFSVFIYRNFAFCKDEGYTAFMTPFVWMFIQSYEKLRKFIINFKGIETLIQMEYSAFEDATVPICSFVLSNSKIDKTGNYLRLSDFRGGMEVQKEKVIEAQANTKCNYRYYAKQSDFLKIPGAPLAYWASQQILNSFASDEQASKLADFRHGMSTSDNNRFLRYWFEPSIANIGFEAKSKDDTNAKKWYVYLKGGAFRRWYGNYDYVVNWQYDGKEIKDISNIKYPYLNGNLDFVLGGQKYFFKPGYTWSSLTSGKLGIRKFDTGCLFDAKGQCYFPYGNMGDYLLSFYNSKVFSLYGDILSPTLDYNSGVISKVPIIQSNIYAASINALAEENVRISKQDWDCFEYSWNFQQHPLVKNRNNQHQSPNEDKSAFRSNNGSIKISEQFELWKRECDDRFYQLKANEEEINRIFIEIYGLQGELLPDVAEKDITVRKADLGRDIRSLISYAVGCMLGRYSLDIPGVVYAGGNWDPTRYITYPVDQDGILPITDDEYFRDDIVSMFVRWVKVVFGEETLEENLQFIANAINTSGGSAREVIRLYFINDFYSDHIKTYQKRPIYWQFDSGKQNGFKALMYLHRYDQDTVARLRTDYVHELQDRFRTQLDDAKKTAESGDSRQKVVANKRVQKLDKQLAELNKYEELVHHIADMRIHMDLDDGVKANYEKLKDVLTRIK